MKRNELYEKIIELSDKYNIPLKINKQSKKSELQKVYDNLEKLKDDNEPIDEEYANTLYVDEVDEDTDNNIDIDKLLNELTFLNNTTQSKTKETRRKIKNNKIEKKQIDTSISNIQTLKNISNDIINNYIDNIEILIKSINKDVDNSNNIINDYNELRDTTVNKLNMEIDCYEGKISNSFYTWIESQLDISKNKLEKKLNM